MSCCAFCWYRASAAMAQPPLPRSRFRSRRCCFSGSSAAGLGRTGWRSGSGGPKIVVVEKAAPLAYHTGMNATQLKRLLERVQAWPETAQEELVAVANEIESELQASD